MAKKRPDPTKSRLKRFGKWSDSHRADILEEVGLSEKDFRALSRGSRKNTLDRALSLDKQAKDPAYTAAPQSVEQLRAAAGNAGQLRYGQAQSTLDQYGQAIDPWFDDYRRRVTAMQQGQQQQAQGIINQSTQQAEQQGQTVLPQAGVDPNSEAGQNDILAAASRKALADAFTKVLQANQSSTDAAYVQMGNVAEASRVGEHSTQKRSLSDLLRERGAFETDYLTTARDREHTKGLERKAFGLKVSEAQADVNDDIRDDKRIRSESRLARRTKRAADKAKDRKDRTKFEVEYGIPYDAAKDGLSPQEKQQIKAYQKDPDGPGPKLSPSEKRARRKDKQERGQRADFIRDALENRPAYPKGHPQEGKKPTRQEIISQLIRKGYSRDEIRKAAPHILPRRPTAPSRDQQPG